MKLSRDSLFKRILLWFETRRKKGMAYPHEPQRSETWAMQREREKERRRLRDRQRRQNMSQEQRERHLARRRRNYLLRRLKAESAKLNPQERLTDPVAEFSDTSSSAAALTIAFSQSMSTTDAGGLLEDGAHKLRSSPRRLRLHQIRYLARALSRSAAGVSGHGSSHQTGAHHLRAEEISSTNNCGSVTRLRLVHVKRLARALNSGAKENSFHRGGTLDKLPNQRSL
ncbi:hypothetical protein Dimus_035074 [Dionaea muscipula]